MKAEPVESEDLTEAPYAASLSVLGEIGRRGKAVAWRVAEEVPVAVLLNGESYAVMMATPADLEDFAAGFAITEGLIDRAAEIESLRVCQAADGLVANIVLDPHAPSRRGGRRRRLAGTSSCGVCGAQTLGAALPRLPRVKGAHPTRSALRRAFAALPEMQEMNAANRSTHAAAYCDPGGSIRMLREDVGRHNALDKLGGALARAGLPADRGFFLLSSRISVEMVQKAAMLGSPFLAAVSAPTALAIRQAGSVGMGLASAAKGEIMFFDTRSIDLSADSPVAQGVFANQVGKGEMEWPRR